MTQVHTINGAVFKEMLCTAAALLERNKELINALNVFPVPDGDTGSNMSMTMNAAVRELKDVDTSRISNVAHAAARGALRGARGNSGVILSQIFRGMDKAFEGLECAGAQDWANALAAGSEAAYKAVMKPKEGTILTVARVVGEQAQQAAPTANVYKLIDDMIRNGEEILARTPDMLPVLKDAGVVDSGGKGLIFLYRGFKMALDGDSIDDYDELGRDMPAGGQAGGIRDNEDVALVDSLDDIAFAYCTEFFIEHLNEAHKEGDAGTLLEHYQRIGDSVVVVADAGLIKVHLHTNVPGKALQMALRLGEINGVKIENMKEQHRRLMQERKECEKEFGMVAVSMGDGLERILKDLAVDVVVSGGQTMNPSALDMERAIKRVNARQVFVLPNNKNVILAAQQAAELVQKSAQIQVTVVATKTITQGVAAALAFSEHDDAPGKLKGMQEAAGAIISGELTYSVRTTSLNGRKIAEGDYMGLVEGDIVASGPDMNETLDALLGKMMSEEREYITIFYGEQISAEEAKALTERLEDAYPDVDVVLRYGGQPLYYYFISVE